MTGDTTQISGLATEGRDPSPSPGVNAATSGSSDDADEPWDELPKNRKRVPPQQEVPSNPMCSMMSTAGHFISHFYGQDDRLEDGDLPTLSLKAKQPTSSQQPTNPQQPTRPQQPVSGQLVSGEKKKRPLSPPSTNGLAIKDNDPPMRRTRSMPKAAMAKQRPRSPSEEKPRAPTPKTAKTVAAQRQFWSQLDPESTYEDLDTSFSRDEQDEDVPDDELAARRAGRARELDDKPRQDDEEVEGEERYQRKKYSAASEVHSNMFEETDKTCLEATLSSITDMCGGIGHPPLPNKDERPPKILEPQIPDDAEEHTAIEVEYVDPGLGPAETKSKKMNGPMLAARLKALPHAPADDGLSVELNESEASAWSSSRKNAVLAAMARKAKEDFEKHEQEKLKQIPSMELSGAAVAAISEQDTNDIYNSFSPSEKRKFLKLVNQGLSSTKSASCVVEDRTTEKEAKASDSGKKRFSFWKKSPNRDAPRSPLPTTPTAKDWVKGNSDAPVDREARDNQDLAAPSTPRDVDLGAKHATSSPAITPGATYSPDVTPMQDDGDEIQDASLVAASGPSEDYPTVESTSAEPGVKDIGADSEVLAEDEEKKDGEDMDGFVAAGAAAGIGAAAIYRATNASQSRSYETYEEDDDESDEDDDEVVGKRFPRSGVNYYDGVRREVPEEEDSDEDALNTSSSTNKSSSKGQRGLASLTMSPRSLGFNAMSDTEKKNAAAIGDADEDVSRSVSPRGRQAKSGKERSAALSPDGSTSARRRYLGIPILSGKGFEPLLEEDDDGTVTATAGRSAPVVASGQVSPEVKANDADKSKREVQESVARTSTEEKPMPSMEDPFYGIEADEDKQDKGQAQEMDTSLDSYLDSATLPTYTSNDHMSVVSGRSGYTGGTGVTGTTVHTQSSRKRRPGAAKDRLAKAKEAEKAASAKLGWHDTIRAAAVNSGRTWDPKKGWVDYRDPSEDTKPIPNPDERLQISLDRVAMRSAKNPESSSQPQADDRPEGRLATVPFPPKWETDRSKMVSPEQKEKTVSRSARTLGTPPLSPRPTPEVEPSSKQGSISVVPDDSPAKPRGWMDSMKAASAEVNKDGKRWDPKKGWVGLDKGVVEESPLSPREVSTTRGDADSAAEDLAEGKAEANDINSRAQEKTSPTSIFAALTQSPKANSVEEARGLVQTESRTTAEARGLVQAESGTAEKLHPKETKMSSWIEKSANKPTTPRSEQSTESSDQAVVASVGSEKYVQLGDNGSVKSVRRKQADREDKLPFHPMARKTAARTAKAAKGDDDDRAPLLADDMSDRTSLLADDMSDSNEARAPAIKVLKEKIDESDRNLFSPKDDSTTTSSRRGRGPVDVDEVDDLDTDTESEDDGDDDHNPPWAPDSFMQGGVSPGMFVKPAIERSMDRPTRASAAAPTPPKLQMSMRDTSPIRSDKVKASEMRSPRDVTSPVVAAQVTGAPPDPSPSRHESRAIPTSDAMEGQSVSSSVRRLAHEWESRASRGTQIVHDSSDSFDFDERNTSGLGDFSPSSNDENSWSDGDDNRARRATPAGTQEWKSFLGKKVKAETAAAVRQDETKKQDGSLRVPYPIPRAPGAKSVPPVSLERSNINNDGSSLLPADAEGSPALSASSAAARRRDRSGQFQSSPGGFSDVSPILVEGEFDNDDSRIERVSDTGTAVEQGTFLKRLSACAAPISRALGQSGIGSGDAVPSAHLAFMRTSPAAAEGSGKEGNPSSAKFVPPAFCGRPNTIAESDDDDDATSQDEPRSPVGSSFEKSREMASMASDMRSSSSVASEDFGARTSYLEAIAMKTAVSTSKKKSRKSKKSPGDRSDSKTAHAERWQAFLERKASQSSSPTGSQARGSTDVSRAAEKYATGKVEEMMKAMSSRSKSTPRSWRSLDADVNEEASGDSVASPSSPSQMTPRSGDRSSSSSSKAKRKSESAKAAEELAAARVEAMMAAMQATSLDEGEI